MQLGAGASRCPLRAQAQSPVGLFQFGMKDTSTELAIPPLQPAPLFLLPLSVTDTG
jgi:hypothetical protein